MEQTTIWRPCSAELAGTFAWIFIGAGTSSVASLTNGAATAGVVGVALAHGLVVMAMVSAHSHISGAHINPAVTIAMLVTNRIKAVLAGAYILSQLAGAALAGLLLASILPSGAESGYLGTTDLRDGMIGPGGGVAVEAVLTFFLVMTIFGTAVDERSPKVLAPLAIGVVIASDTLLGGWLTGAAMNPARHFGPALASGHWDHVLVYWIGPILGGGLAAVLYDSLFLRGES